MKERSRNYSDIVTVMTIAVMFAVMLLLVVFAAGSYRRATVSAAQNSDTRAVLTYMVNCIRDSGDSRVYIADRSGTHCLVIDSGDGFEQRFYEYKGILAEEYVSPASAPDPGNALMIGDCGDLELSIDKLGVLRIKTDSGVSYVGTERHKDE